MRILVRLGIWLGAGVALLLLALWFRYGGGGEFPDRSSDPLLPGAALELVADLELPPGNIAVTDGGRIFFSFHPEAAPADPGGRARWMASPSPFPSADFQLPTAASRCATSRCCRCASTVRIDCGCSTTPNHGTGPRRASWPSILASGRLLAYRFDFPFGDRRARVAPERLPGRRRTAAASTSPRPASSRKTPAHRRPRRRQAGESRRLLEGHESVDPRALRSPVVQGRRDARLRNLRDPARRRLDRPRPRAASGSTSRPVTAQPACTACARADLDHESLSASDALASRVERFALKSDERRHHDRPRRQRLPERTRSESADACCSQPDGSLAHAC